VFGPLTPPGDDPGWTPVLKSLAWFAIPGIGVQQMRKRAPSMNGLSVLRLIFMAFVNALVLIGVVIAILVNLSRFKGGAVAPFPVAIGLVLAGLLANSIGARFERPLDCSDEQHLANSYRTRFFIRVAFSESTALLGFVGFILTDRWWLYPLGAAFAAFGYARLAPTSAHLGHDQTMLQDSGCGRSLVSALALSKPQGWGGGRR
jgi:F0F1-type ATP synthase membrane subunit c/vacuolar-type H+-ATPase subunit K